jgi:hypothetical protein
VDAVILLSVRSRPGARQGEPIAPSGRWTSPDAALTEPTGSPQEVKLMGLTWSAVGVNCHGSRGSRRALAPRYRALASAADARSSPLVDQSLYVNSPNSPSRPRRIYS